MGHFIYAEVDGVEVAELNRSAFNPLNKEIYLALDCVDGNFCVVSGCGTNKEFNRTQIINAFKRILDNKDLRPEAEFLLNCLFGMEDKILISFT
jgi:hypothetical protein